MKANAALAPQRGVTMLEVIVALAAVAVIMGAALVSASGFLAQRTLAGWSRSIVNDIRSAQQLGIARRDTASVTFADTAPPRYSTAIGGATVRSQALPPELVVTAGTIRFDSLGVPPSGATLTLTDTRSGETVTISVAPLTGAVTVQ